MAFDMGNHIQIDIKIGDSKDDAIVTLHGSDVAIISDAERRTFGIQDGQLKDAACKYDGSSRKPTDVFVRSPTPWDDLYTRYSWSQVKRTIVPKSAKIIGMNTNPVIVATTPFKNKSDVTAKCNASITQSVEESVGSTWMNGGEMTTSREVSFSLGFGGSSLSSNRSISFTSSWGKQKEHVQQVTLGSSAGLEVELEPGQSVVGVLTATRGTMDIEVEYTTSLQGGVAVNYYHKYKGHHFWCYDVNEVRKAAGLPSTVISKQRLRVQFYTNSEVTVTNE